VREEAVSADTRVELEYEHDVTRDTDQVRAATASWGPSDRFILQGDWLKFADLESDGEESHLFSLHGEMRETIGGYDLRITPGVAFNAGRNGLAGTDVEALVSSSKARFRSFYRGYAREYQNLYRPRSVFGDVNRDAGFSAAVDLRDDLRMTGEWNRTRGFALEEGVQPTEGSGQLGLLYQKGDLLGWRFSYQKRKSRTDGGASSKALFQSLVESQLPDAWCRRLFLQRVKTEAFLRAGHRSAPAPTDPQDFRQWYVRWTTTIQDQVQGGLFYRRDDLHDAPSGGSRHLKTRSERLLLNLTHERWRALQANLRVENRMAQIFRRGSSLTDVSLSHYFQLNVRASPGRMAKVFSPLYFEAGLSESLYGSGATAEPMSSRIWRALGGGRGRLEDAQVRRDWFVKSEYRPGSQWALYSLIERNFQDADSRAGRIEDRAWRWTEKADVKLGLRTRLNLQYRRLWQAWNGPKTDRSFEPSAWIERRWTPGLQNTVFLLYRSRSQEDAMADASRSWEVRYDVLWTREQFLGIRRLEVLQSLSGFRRRTRGDARERVSQFASSSAIDLYPLRSMAIRLRVDAGRYSDFLVPENDLTRLSFALKILWRF
jgi:hypothetical protein